MTVDPSAPATAHEKRMCFDKQRYRARYQAIAAAKWRGIPTFKTYRCPVCAGWHITTKRKG